MFIHVQETPNPNTLKFVFSDNILPEGSSYHFTDAEEAKISPLALELFKLDGIKNVFFGLDFISIMLYEVESWIFTKPKIVAFLTDFFSQKNISIIKEGHEDSANTFDRDVEFKEEDKDVVEIIIELFEDRIRPAVAMDGGDIMFKKYDDGIVYLKMYGACEGCPSSTVTLKEGIENMLKYYVPQVKEVIALDY